MSRSGVLYKRSDYLKEWKPRHFTLEGLELRYALPDAPLEVKGSMELAMCKITRGDAPVRSGAQNFHLVTVTKLGANQEYQLGALHSRDADEWTAALKSAAGEATRLVVKCVQDERRAEAARGAGSPRGSSLPAVPEAHRSEPTAAPAARGLAPEAAEAPLDSARRPGGSASRRGPSPTKRRKQPSVPPAPLAAEALLAPKAPAPKASSSSATPPPASTEALVARQRPAAAARPAESAAARPAESAADKYLVDEPPAPEPSERQAVIRHFLAPSLVYLCCAALPPLADYRGPFFFASLAAVGYHANSTVGLAVLLRASLDDLAVYLTSTLKLN